jgi:hypothetical protein
LRRVLGWLIDKNEPGSRRRFRIVYSTETQFRLMERPGDPPARWTFNFTEEPDSATVRVRDFVSTEDEIPWHRGLELEVDVVAGDLDEAISSGGQWAETALTLLAAAGRAPATPAEPQVAYEITPDVREREFAQWYTDLPILVGKTPVPRDAFAALFNPLLAGPPGTTDRRLTQRLLLSLSWHRLAMSETDPLTRFLILWLAFEALEPLLRHHYGVADQGFQGLRALADELGEGGSAFITDVLGLRRDLFHTRRVPIDDMKERASECLRRLQRLLVAGWLTLLGRPQSELALFPEQAVVPYPARLIVFATIVQQDETLWDSSRHPHFEGELRPIRVDTGDPRDVGVSFETKLTARNAEGMQLRRMEIRGPEGPSVGTWERFEGVDGLAGSERANSD